MSIRVPYQITSANYRSGIVEDARKALLDGREPPLPILHLPTEAEAAKLADNPENHSGLAVDKATAIPEHLRTSSTQVEPATPPKWMTYADAEEAVKQANDWVGEDEVKGVPKKERRTSGLRRSQSNRKPRADIT